MAASLPFPRFLAGDLRTEWMLLVAPATGVWVPVTLVIFGVYEVVEKVVEKTAALDSALTWGKARKNAALHQNHLITTYFSITWKRQQIFTTTAKLSD